MTSFVLPIQTIIRTFGYKSVVMFGGCHDDWMLVAKQRYKNVHTKLVESQTRKYLFVMSKPKVSGWTYVIRRAQRHSGRRSNDSYLMMRFNAAGCPVVCINAV